MMFKDKYIHKLYAFVLAAGLRADAGGLRRWRRHGADAGSGTRPPCRNRPPQEMCEADGGRYNEDGSCTSADDLAEEMALSAAQGSRHGGVYGGDGGRRRREGPRGDGERADVRGRGHDGIQRGGSGRNFRDGHGV